MPKKVPKIPKFPKKIASKQSTSSITLTTAQDYLDQGVEEEESGDRWIISDLSKSLRFYQKAYEHYIEAVNKDDDLVDAYYNADRLLFHVWGIYHSVPKTHLTNVDGCDVANYSLLEIKEKHDFVIRKFPNATWELYYNLVLINTELIEQFDEGFNYENLLKICDDSVLLLGQILDYQLGELDSFLKRLENPQGEENQNQHEHHDDEEDDRKDDYDVMEQITPSSVLETVLTGYKLIEASYENCENQIQMNLLDNNFKEFSNKLKDVLGLLLSKFDAKSNPADQYELNFSEQEIEDIKLVIHSNNAFFTNDFDALVTYWSNSIELNGLENSASRYLAEADSFQNFRDTSENLVSQEHWVLINHINSNLKKAQEILKNELNQHISNKTNEVSPKVSKIIEILILRADNELARTLFDDLESSVKNRDILRQNSINLLKNGMNLSNTNCGLRETISDKLKREKLRRECVLRLVLLTKESFKQEDLIRNLGVNHYVREVEDLQSIDVYKGFWKNYSTVEQ